MREISSVLIVGLGAIGSIWAVRLQDCDPACVRVLVDEARIARLRAEGIVFNGQRRDFDYVLPGPDQPPADLILIATKSDGLRGAIASIGGFIHAETQILPLLNGVTSEADVAAAYGWEHVLYAFIVGHGSTRIGNAITFDGVGRIVFGEADNQTLSPRVAAVQRFFERSGVSHEIPPDLRLAQWQKFVLNVGVNQASAVLRADYGTFQHSERVRAVALDLMNEAILIAEREGIREPEKILPWCMEFIRNAPPAFRSSMLQDIEAGNRTEVDLFGETVCALGHRHRVPTPYNAIFVKLIRALEPVR